MKIKELRLEKNKTQNEIATILGISRQVFANYENEINYPDPTMLIKIADYFDVSIDFLVGREDDFGSKAEKKIDKKFSSDNLRPEEIEMIKGIRELNFTDQNALKVVINSFLSKNSIAKEKVKK